MAKLRKLPPSFVHSCYGACKLVHHQTHLARDMCVAVVFVGPGRYLHEAVLATGVETLAGRLVAIGKSVVKDFYYWQSLGEELFQQLAFVAADECRNNNRSSAGGTHHGIALNVEEWSIGAVAY